jgi:hypothetical protein
MLTLCAASALRTSLEKGGCAFGHATEDGLQSLAQKVLEISNLLFDNN